MWGHKNPLVFLLIPSLISSFRWPCSFFTKQNHQDIFAIKYWRCQIIHWFIEQCWLKLYTVSLLSKLKNSFTIQLMFVLCFPTVTMNDWLTLLPKSCYSNVMKRLALEMTIHPEIQRKIWIMSAEISFCHFLIYIKNSKKC
jgi:hypothetical protein